MSKCLEGHLERDWLRLQKGLEKEFEGGGPAISSRLFTTWEEQKTRAKMMKPFFDVETCLEYGAGPGLLCRALREEGFEAAYKIIDIPELWPVQKAYFARHGIGGVEWLDEIEEVDLVIAHFSISEAPLEWRDEVFSWHPKYFHIIYQKQHTPPELVGQEQTRNVEYFRMLQEKNKNYIWRSTPYAPYANVHVLLIGTRID